MMMDNQTKRTESSEEEEQYQSSSGMQLLPQDTIMDILSRLPIYSIFQCTLVSKAWRDIIVDNPIFATMQHNRALENQNTTLSFMMCLGNGVWNPILYLVERGVSSRKLTVMDAKLTCLYGWFRVMGSCNGLLCFAYNCRDGRDYYESDEAYVSNPITGEYALLPCEDSVCSWVCGFGFDSLRQEYKVVRVAKVRRDCSLKVDIHTLGTNSWRLIENGAPLSYTMHMFHQFSYVLVNGCLHWCRYPTKPLSIFSLDMGNEQFREVPAADLNCTGYIYLMNLKGCLAIVKLTGVDTTVHIWLMKEYNVKESWTKQVNVRLPTWFSSSPGYWPFDDESLVDDLQVVHHPRFSADSFGGRNLTRVTAHVGSLISLKTILGKEEKRVKVSKKEDLMFFFRE
ncbi:hypothetical protein AAC387_Pa11g0447 [Persea americana]